MDNEAMADTWCRMWSEDPTLAHEVLAPDGRQWSGQTPALDDVVGPEQQVEFVTAYRAQHVNVFSPRVLADGGDRFAYLWDVRLPDGTVHTGLDVNVLRGGLVADNWTFVAPRRCELADPEVSGDASLDVRALTAFARRWTSVWGGEVELVDELVTEDFLAWSQSTEVEEQGTGSDVLVARVLAETGRHDTRGVELHREPVVDVARQRVALLWTATEDQDGTRTEVGGVDLLAVRGGRVSRSWTLRGTRPFAY